MRRVARFFALSTVLFVAASAPGQQPSSTRTIAARNAPAIRCAYHGRWGTFHLLGPVGTAGYSFDGEKYVDNLSFRHESDDYYYYSPGKDGAKSVSGWAFAKRPEQDGSYAVWRRTRKGWGRYECTKRWGDFNVEGVSDDVQEQLDALRQDVDGHESRLQTLERSP